MEKLELKHLAPYLPYGLKIMTFSNYRPSEIICNYGIRNCSDYPITTYEDGKSFGRMLSEIKPILRPLSDLFKLIDWGNNSDPYMIGYKYGVEKVFEDGEEFYANEHYADYCESPKCYTNITSFDWWLFEHHFDVFGLIDKGLAIDINTLGK